MSILAIDLGSTNTKAAFYSNNLTLLSTQSRPVTYLHEKGWVEFNADSYFQDILSLIQSCYQEAGSPVEKVQIVCTGQAESLVVLDKNGDALRNGISWLDMRSSKECLELSAHFDSTLCYQITGQPEIIPTWPLTKILWLNRHEPEIFDRIDKFLMIKDYILFRLTGRYVGEHSIYPFSHYFDVCKKEYWMDPLRYCGVNAAQLPELVAPCSIVGDILPSICSATGLPSGSFANAGTLDHFAAMIGTGNIGQGPISESAGTVSSIATFVDNPFDSPSRIPIYCGPFPASYIYLPVCESGGISLEWYKNTFMPDFSFDQITHTCAQRSADKQLTFLPYLTGVNPPEFNANACGVFYGATIHHDRFDFALSILYGVASLLRKNIDFFKMSGIAAETIISTGGGAKSALWSQIKADICNLPVLVPENQEAPCFGAAIIGAVSAGSYSSYQSAIQDRIKIQSIYEPNPNRSLYEEKYHAFCQLYETLTPLFSS